MEWNGMEQARNFYGENMYNAKKFFQACKQRNEHKNLTNGMDTVEEEKKDETCEKKSLFNCKSFR